MKGHFKNMLAWGIWQDISSSSPKHSLDLPVERPNINSRLSMSESMQMGNISVYRSWLIAAQADFAYELHVDRYTSGIT